MNEWVRRSIKLALTENYLDRLHEIYGVEEPSRRAIPPTIEQQIRRAYESRDKVGLIKSLFKLDKFPLNDPYIPFLRKYEEALSLNPRTVERIGNRLLNIPWYELIIRCTEPIDPNRRIGRKFHNWIKNIGYPLRGVDEFRDSDEFAQADGSVSKIAILDTTETEMRRFANEELDCGLDKKPDFIAKVGGRYIIGEAKYIGDFGGNQNNHFKEVMDFVLEVRGDAIRVGILDGVVWLDKNAEMCKRVRRVPAVCLSALLLKDYFESLLD